MLFRSASRGAQGVSGPLLSCVWNLRVFPEMHDGDSAPSCCAFIHRVAFKEVSGHRFFLPSLELVVQPFRVMCSPSLALSSPPPWRACSPGTQTPGSIALFPPTPPSFTKVSPVHSSVKLLIPHALPLPSPLRPVWLDVVSCFHIQGLCSNSKHPFTFLLKTVDDARPELCLL